MVVHSYRTSAPFGVFRFSHGEGHILYCAERKVKASEYYDADVEWQNEEKVVESKVVRAFGNCLLG